MLKRLLQALRLTTALAALASALSGCCQAPAPLAPADSDAYLLCFWNVENLFDDRLDHRENKADQEYDEWFAQDHEALRLKLDHVSDALMKLNDGKGPDIIALAEVESVRAAELLQEALNQKVSDPSLRYEKLLMKELVAGRHIAPAIITRLPVARERTRLHGSRLRILEGHIGVRGHDLVVLVSHWTARVTDEHGEHRDKYGDQIYGLFKGMHKSEPKVDMLICGDFNDPPEAPSVTKHLHAVGDLESVLHPVDGPYLLDLFANKDPGGSFGTHFYGSKWFTFDQVVVSPGLLDERGWACEPDSAQVVNTLVRPGDPKHRPWRFGNKHDRSPRGYSDHFPVTVRLKVYDRVEVTRSGDADELRWIT